MSNKDAYRELCDKDDTIPLFSQSWWLDMVCGENGWDVAVYGKDERIRAALPFYMKKKYGITVVSQPKYTQTLGVWFASSSTKYAKRLGQEKNMINSLVESLPKHHVFFQSFHYSFTNWLPFYHLGFEQTSKYTYVIDDLTDMDRVWQQTNENIKRAIRKASRLLTVVNDLPAKEFYSVLQKTYQRQNLNIPMSYNELENVMLTTSKKKAGRSFAAIDESGRVHAVLYLVWDKNSSYYLIGGGDPELRNSGASSLCIWEAIKFSSTVTNSFDLEGSMVEGIERFFRGFGAKQKEYFRIMKFSSIWLSLMYHFKRYYTKKI